MILTRQRRPTVRRRPTITALTGPDELAVRHALVLALMGAQWGLGGWAEAEQTAVNLLDDLAGDGYAIVKADWS
jgi:hypothetical protein